MVVGQVSEGGSVVPGVVDLTGDSVSTGVVDLTGDNLSPGVSDFLSLDSGLLNVCVATLYKKIVIFENILLKDSERMIVNCSLS